MLPQNTESTNEENIQRYIDYNKSKEIQAFIKSDESLGINIKDVNEIINGAQFKSNYCKEEIFDVFFKMKNRRE